MMKKWRKEEQTRLKGQGHIPASLCIWAGSKTHVNEMWATVVLLTKDVHIWLMAHILNNQQKKKCFASQTTKLGHVVPHWRCPRQPCLITALKHPFFIPFSRPLLISLAWTVVLFLCMNLCQAIFVCWVLLQLNHLSLVCHFLYLPSI